MRTTYSHFVLKKQVRTFLSICFILFTTLVSGQYTVTVGPSLATYTRLALAFNAISAGTYSGAVHVQIIGSTSETVKASLTPHAFVDSVMVYPTTTAVIQGNMNDDLIELVNADHVYIDGRINRTGSVRSLTITNSNTSSLSYVYCFRNATTFSSLNYVALKGSGKGVIRFVLTNTFGSGGNTDNVIEHCFIGDGSGTPQYGIYSEGGFNRLSARNAVRYNEICNYYSTTFHSNGVYLYDYNSDWEIKGNSFYHTASRTSSYLNTAINAVPNNQSYLYKHQIHDNFIGGSADSCGGNTSTITAITGINLTASSSSLSTISNNIIRNIRALNGFTGVQTGYGKIRVNNNFVGDSVGNGLIQVVSGYAAGIVVGIHDSVRIYNNFIGAISASCSVTGVDLWSNYSNISSVLVRKNLVGSRITANSISSNATGTTVLSGIKSVSSVNLVVDSNAIVNLAGINAAGQNCSLYGIINQSGYTRGNEVGHLSTVTQGTTYASCQGISTFEAKGNFVHHLEALTEYYNVWGLSAYVAVNNIISLGFGISSGAQFVGIYGNTASQAGYFHNTVCLGGVCTTTNSSACLTSVYQVNSNILYCARTMSASGSGANYCIFSIAGGAVGNCFYVSGSGNAVAWNGGFSYSSWGTGSSYSNPTLGNVAGDLAFHYKPGITLNGTNVYGGFISSVPIDYFGFTRPNPPTMGAIEKTTCITIPYVKNISACTSYSLGNQTYTASGTYTQALSYQGGCDTLLTLHLQVGAPNVTITPSFTSTCAGENNTLTAVGATNYTWVSVSSPTTAAIVVNPNSTTVYTVLASDLPACDASHTIELVVNQLPTVSVPAGQVCIGDSFTLTPSGASTYTYLNGGPVVTPVTTSTYAVRGINVFGCFDTTVTQVVVNPLPVLSVNSGSVCLAKSYTLNPTGAVNYSYSPAGPIVTPVNSSTYMIVGMDGNGCISSIVGSVAVMPLPSVSINSGSICLGSTFTLQPAGGVTYVYHNGGPFVTPLATTVYSVSSVSSQGCLSSLPALGQVNVIPLPSLSIVATPSFVCEGEEVTLVVSGAATYTWGDGGNSPAITATLAAGTTPYHVSGTDALSGCTGSASTQISVDLCTGVADANKVLFQVFPNPTQNEVFIRGPLDIKVEVWDLSGRMLHTQPITDDLLELNMAFFASGTYMLVLRGADFVEKIVVVKQ